jgi:hypothetical protein
VPLRLLREIFRFSSAVLAPRALGGPVTLCFCSARLLRLHNLLQRYMQTYEAIPIERENLLQLCKGLNAVEATINDC